MDQGSEPARVEEAPGDVVDDAAEASGCAAEVFEQPIHGLGGAVRRAWMVEERQDVVTASLHRLPQRPQLLEAGRDAAVDAGDEPGHDLLPFGWLVGLVGLDHALIEAPGDLERDMPLVGEHLREPVLLLGGQQPSPGPGDVSDAVERVTGTPPMPQRLLLDALPAAVEVVPISGPPHG